MSRPDVFHPPVTTRDHRGPGPDDGVRCRDSAPGHYHERVPTMGVQPQVATAGQQPTRPGLRPTRGGAELPPCVLGNHEDHSVARVGGDHGVPLARAGQGGRPRRRRRGDHLAGSFRGHGTGAGSCGRHGAGPPAAARIQGGMGVTHPGLVGRRIAGHVASSGLGGARGHQRGRTRRFQGLGDRDSIHLQLAFVHRGPHGLRVAPRRHRTEARATEGRHMAPPILDNYDDFFIKQ